MKFIFDIFTSKAKVVVLQTLYFQEQPIPLRHLAEISNLPIYSVQNATCQLLDDELIIKIEEGNNTLFKLNKDHPLYNTLEQIFIIEMKDRIALNANSFEQKARRALEFINTTNVIFKHAKKKKR